MSSVLFDTRNVQVYLDFLKYLPINVMNLSVWYVYFFLEQVSRRIDSVLKFKRNIFAY